MNKFDRILIKKKYEILETLYIQVNSSSKYRFNFRCIGNIRKTRFISKVKQIQFANIKIGSIAKLEHSVEYIRMIETYDLGLVKQASFVSQFDPVSLSFAIVIAALLQRDEAITIVCTSASGASARSWRKGRRRIGGRATAGLRRFVDRKMIVARGLSPCKRASRSGSWICGIDGPSRRPAGRHAEFAGTNRRTDR